MLTIDDFVGFYLFNKYLFEMMDIFWCSFLLGNVLSPSNPFSFFIAWWTLGINSIPFLLLWLTQYSYYSLELAFILGLNVLVF